MPKSKPRPNLKEYLQSLRAMTPQQRVDKAFELSAMSKQLFLEGLRERFPDVDETKFHAIMLRRLEKCHNRNY